jgi:hypothetical protein
MSLDAVPQSLSPTPALVPSESAPEISQAAVPGGKDGAPEPPVLDAKAEETPEPKVEEKKDDRFATKFAALARKERQIQAREQALKDQEKKFQDFEEKRVKAKESPLPYLEELGWSYQDLTQFILNDQKPSAEMIAKRAEAEVRRLREEQVEKEKKAQEEAKRTQEEAQTKALAGVTRGITQYLEANPSTFELTKAHPEGSELVLNVMIAHHEKHGRVLSIPEATESVEKYLESETEKWMGLSKLQKKLKPKEEPAPSKPELFKQAESPKTLTNAAQTQVPAPVDRPLSLEESRQRAARMLKWT